MLAPMRLSLRCPRNLPNLAFDDRYSRIVFFGEVAHSGRSVAGPSGALSGPGGRSVGLLELLELSFRRSVGLQVGGPEQVPKNSQSLLSVARFQGLSQPACIHSFRAPSCAAHSQHHRLCAHPSDSAGVNITTHICRLDSAIWRQRAG